MQQVNSNDRDIALVGMACRFPGAEDVESWWHNLINGVESLVRVDNEQVDSADGGYIPVEIEVGQRHADLVGLGLGGHDKQRAG